MKLFLTVKGVSTDIKAGSQESLPKENYSKISESRVQISEVSIYTLGIEDSK